MDDAIEDRVGKRRVADDLIPALDWNLAGDDNRAGVVAVLDNLQEVAALFGIQLIWSPIVEDEKIDSSKGAQGLGIAAIAAGQRQRCEQRRDSVIEDGCSFSACGTADSLWGRKRARRGASSPPRRAAGGPRQGFICLASPPSAKHGRNEKSVGAWE